MKRMLINATQPEELRVALVDGQRLYDLDIEATVREQKKSNIYKGKIVRLEPSLEAAFVSYGSERHGFLPFKEISHNVLREQMVDDEKSSGRINVKEHLKEGMEFIIQIEKEERGNKGAALTTSISLAGRYLVLMPNNPRAGGVSRQIEGSDRTEAREALNQLNIPKGVGLILRTAGVGKSIEELQWDLDYLLQVWDSIKQTAAAKEAPFLIYQESEVIIRAIRDYLRTDINEIWIDDEKTYQRARDFMEMVMPHNLSKLKLYKESDPLFTRYQIENQIESAFSREVRLPSGGALVIDHTEALISIDINSARSTAGSDIEETALNTNVEAAAEIARQLRLRDLGGLIVIDFIDMMNNRNQREVENAIKEHLKVDRARVQVGRISRFGLLEMSRQRLRPSLGDSSHITCPRCQGTGTIRSTESLALSLVRLIEEEAIKDMTSRVIVQLPVDASSLILNEKREAILNVEKQHDVEVTIIPNPNLETPHFEVTRIRQSEADSKEYQKPSYQMISEVESEVSETTTTHRRKPVEQPALQQVIPSTPKPPSVEKTEKSKGLISRLFGSLFGIPEKKEEKKPRRGRGSDNNQSRRRGNRNRNSEDSRNNRNKQQGNSNNRQRNNNRRNSNRPNNKNSKTKDIEQKNNTEANSDNSVKKSERNNQTRSDNSSRNRGRGRGRNNQNRRRDENQKEAVQQKESNISTANSSQTDLKVDNSVKTDAASANTKSESINSNDNTSQQQVERMDRIKQSESLESTQNKSVEATQRPAENIEKPQPTKQPETEKKVEQEVIPHYSRSE